MGSVRPFVQLTEGSGATVGGRLPRRADLWLAEVASSAATRRHHRPNLHPLRASESRTTVVGRFPLRLVVPRRPGLPNLGPVADLVLTLRADARVLHPTRREDARVRVGYERPAVLAFRHCIPSGHEEIIQHNTIVIWQALTIHTLPRTTLWSDRATVRHVWALERTAGVAGRAAVGRSREVVSGARSSRRRSETRDDARRETSPILDTPDRRLEPARRIRGPYAQGSTVSPDW